MDFALVSVYNTDNRVRSMISMFLYELLQERKPWQNISHKEMPTYFAHEEFIESRPYRDWFAIQNGHTYEFVGSIYVTRDNEIGIHLLDRYQRMGYGKKALEAIYEHFSFIPHFKANIAPLNSGSIAFFVNNGFMYENSRIDNGQLIQYTYRIANPKYVSSGDDLLQHAHQDDSIIE